MHSVPVCLAQEAVSEEDIKPDSYIEVPDLEVETGEATTPAPMADPLRQALEAAYMKNPELESQRKALQVTNERVPQALAGALPSASIGYEKGRQRTRSTGADWNSNDAETRSLNVTQSLFSGGATWASTKAARNEVKAAQARLAQVEQGVLFETLRAYMDVVQAESVLNLSQKNLSVLQKQLEASTQRFEVGEDTRTDVSQSEARTALAESNVSESKSTLAAARATFRKYTGYDPVALVMPDAMPTLPANMEEAITFAEQSNPALLELEYLKNAADYGIDANVGSLFPEVGLRGTMNRQEGVGIFGQTSFDEDQLALTVNFPIFQGGSRYSQIRAAKETYQQRRFQVLDAVNEVRQQAITAWEEVEATRATIQSNRKAIEAARVALDGVRQEQQYGARTTLDVLDAERELFNAEVNLVASQRNHVVAIYNLLAIMGGMTAEKLGLNVTLYDAEEAFEDVEYQFIGF